MPNTLQKRLDMLQENIYGSDKKFHFYEDDQSWNWLVIYWMEKLNYISELSLNEY